jgi:phage terminase large subunit-like protein
MPWNRDFLSRLFGTVDSEGRRQYTQFAVGIPKKNAKSYTMACMSLYCLLADREAMPRIYLCAANQKQASIIFDFAAEIIQKSPYLKRRVKIKRHIKILEDKVYGGRVEALSAESTTKEGYSASAVIFDELHTQPDSRLWDVFRYAGRSRQQPLMGWISTAGDNPQSMAYDNWIKARENILYPDKKPHFLSILYERTAEDDWTSEETWRKCNPGIGYSISLDSIRRDYEDAKGDSLKEATFRRYTLNEWVSNSVTYVTSEQWQKVSRPIAWDEFRTLPTVVGIDLGVNSDLIALAAVARTEEDGFLVKIQYLSSTNLVEGEQYINYPDIRVMLTKYCDLFDIENVDFVGVCSYIKEWRDVQKIDIKSCVIDPFNSLGILVPLTRDGFDCELLRQQAVQMHAPTVWLKRLILSQKIVIDANPVTAWMADNLEVIKNAADLIRPSKKHSKGKIDGITAIITALAKHQTTEYFTSSYEKTTPKSDHKSK